MLFRYVLSSVVNLSLNWSMFDDKWSAAGATMTSKAMERVDLGLNKKTSRIRSEIFTMRSRFFQHVTIPETLRPAVKPWVCKSSFFNRNFQSYVSRVLAAENIDTVRCYVYVILLIETSLRWVLLFTKIDSVRPGITSHCLWSTRDVHWTAVSWRSRYDSLLVFGRFWIWGYSSILWFVRSFKINLHFASLLQYPLLTRSNEKFYAVFSMNGGSCR